MEATQRSLTREGQHTQHFSAIKRTEALIQATIWMNRENIKARGPNLRNLMLDDLKCSSHHNNIIIKIKLHNKCNTPELSRNHPPATPQFIEKLSSMNSIPAAKKVGDRCITTNGRSQTEKAACCMTQLYAMSRGGKSIETGSRLMVARGWSLGKRGRFDHRHRVSIKML